MYIHTNIHTCNIIMYYTFVYVYLRVSIYVYVHMYTRVYLRVCTYVHTYIHMYIHTNIHTCDLMDQQGICMNHMYVHTYVHIYIYPYMYICPYMYIYMYPYIIYPYMYIYIYPCMYIHINPYTYIYIYPYIICTYIYPYIYIHKYPYIVYQLYIHIFIYNVSTRCLLLESFLLFHALPIRYLFFCTLFWKLQVNSYISSIYKVTSEESSMRFLCSNLYVFCGILSQLRYSYNKTSPPSLQAYNKRFLCVSFWKINVNFDTKNVESFHFFEIFP